MNALLLLGRHGSHDELGRVLSGRSGIGLNARGHAEAAALAAAFDAAPPDAIHASPRPRARETAEAVARRHRRRIEIVDALDEVDFGAWAGRSFADLAADPAWDRWNAARATAPTPGGETMAAAVDRAWRHLAGLRGTVLVVSHCDIIRGVVAAALGLSLDRLLAFDCDPGSLTRLVAEDSGFRVAALNVSPMPHDIFAAPPISYYPAMGSPPGAKA